MNIKQAETHILFLEGMLQDKQTKADRIGLEALAVDLRREQATQRQRQDRALATNLAKRHGKPVFNRGRQIA